MPTTESSSTLNQFEALYQFNKALYNSILCLDTLRNQDGFDGDRIAALTTTLNRTRAEVNTYLLGIVTDTETQRSRRE